MKTSKMSFLKSPRLLKMKVLFTQNWVINIILKDEQDATDNATKSVGIRRPIFVVDPQKEIADLKEELQIKDNPDIHVIQDGFSMYYKECEILGQGTSGIVKKCIKQGTDESYAVKIVNYKNDTELLVLVKFSSNYSF